MLRGKLHDQALRALGAEMTGGAARAMKPLPAVISRTNILVVPVERNAPPMPQSTPQITKAEYLIFRLLMPTLCAAAPFSPTAITCAP